MPPDGNFEDYVVLTQDTLQHRGAELKVGGATVSTVHLALSNSAGQLDLRAIPTGNGTVVFPTSGGTLLTNINVSGGTTSSNVSAVTFSNANNVSFGFDGSNVTASASAASTQASINLSAGTTSNLASAFTFSNSNGVSFGLNASTLTASVATSLTNINVSAGTTSNNLSAVTFSNSNGVSFGLNGSVVTASVATALSITCFSQWAEFQTNNVIANSRLTVEKLSIPMNLAATQLICMLDIEGFTNSSGAMTISHAVYTLSAGTASLVSSATRQISWSSGSATSASSQYGGVSGTRYRTVSVSYNFTPGDYLCGWLFALSNITSVVAFGRFGVNVVGTFDGVETGRFLDGSIGGVTAAFPASIAATATNYNRTGLGIFNPGVILSGTGGA